MCYAVNQANYKVLRTNKLKRIKMTGVKALGLFVILFIIECIKCENNQGPSLYCSDLNPQHNIDISQVRELI